MYNVINMSDKKRSTVGKYIQLAEALSKQNYRGNQSHQTLQFRQTLQPCHKQSPSRIQFSFAKLATKKTPPRTKQCPLTHILASFGIQKPCTHVTPTLPWLVGCLHLQGRAALASNTSWLHSPCQSGTVRSRCLAIERSHCFIQPKMQLAAASPIPSMRNRRGHL